MEVYFEAIKTLNGYGVQKVVTGDNVYKLFVRRCFSREEANLVADKMNKEFKKDEDVSSQNTDNS